LLVEFCVQGLRIRLEICELQCPSFVNAAFVAKLTLKVDVIIIKVMTFGNAQIIGVATILCTTE
jgi:hypothetical protein